MSNQQFVFPTPQFAQSTHNIRAAGLEARADITGAASTVPSFEQLKAALINENFISGSVSSLKTTGFESVIYNA